MRVSDLFGDFSGVLDVARLADEKGVDIVYLSDHLAMSREAIDGHGNFAYPLDFAGWFEPLSGLCAIASVTKRIRLGTNILIAPLRPAILLAKQIATLDVISKGRADIAFGVGWNREEFSAADMPFEGRYGYMEEQIKVCRLLWDGAPATFDGKHVQFRNLYSLPLPPQRGRIPIILGIPSTPRNISRMARLADGWYPALKARENLRESISEVLGAFAAEGRDPKTVEITAALRLPFLGSTPTNVPSDPFEEAAGLISAGATTIVGQLFPYCKTMKDIESFIERLVELKRGS